MSGVFQWADGEGGSKTLVLHVKGETTVEPNETVILTLETPVNCVIGAGQATATILNDDSAAVSVINLAVSPVSLDEGDAGTKTVTFTASRGNGTSGACQVAWIRTGTAGTADFSPAPLASGTFAWADGEGTAKSVAFNVAGDTAVEPDETVILTLSNPVGCTIGAASATATIRDDDASTPPPTNADEPENPPTGLTTITATPANFAARYGALTSGQRLLLADGFYGSAVTLNRTNPDAATRPFVIEAENLGGAIFGRIDLNTQGHWLHKLRLDGGGTNNQGVGINADHQWITKCWFRSINGARATANNRAWVRIGWCRFTGPTAPAGTECDHVYFEIPGENRWTTNTSGPHHIWIYRNFFWGGPHTQESHDIYFGTSKAGGSDIPMAHEVYIRRNYWHVGSNRNRAVYLKRGCVVEYNHCATTRPYNFGVRHGMASRFWGNRVMVRAPIFSGVRRTGTGGWQSYAPGRFHDIRGNVFDSPVQIYSGTKGGKAPDCPGCHGTDAACGPWAQAAHCALLVGNQGPGVILGFKQNQDACGVVSSFNATTGVINATFEGGPVHGVRVYRAGRTFPLNPPAPGPATAMTPATLSRTATAGSSTPTTASCRGRPNSPRSTWAGEGPARPATRPRPPARGGPWGRLRRVLDRGGLRPGYLHRPAARDQLFDQRRPEPGGRGV